MLEDDLVLGLDDEPDVEEAVGELGVAGLGLRDHVGVPLLRELAQVVGLGAGDVDRALAGVGGVVEVEHLVGEALEAALGDAISLTGRSMLDSHEAALIMWDVLEIPAISSRRRMPRIVEIRPTA